MPVAFHPTSKLRQVNVNPQLGKPAPKHLRKIMMYLRSQQVGWSGFDRFSETSCTATIVTENAKLAYKIIVVVLHFEL